MEKQKIKLTKEIKVFLLKSITQGEIDVEAFSEVLGEDNAIAPVFKIEVVKSPIPFAYNEDDVVP